jgi:hypothetical protein
VVAAVVVDNEKDDDTVAGLEISVEFADGFAGVDKTTWAGVKNDCSLAMTSTKDCSCAHERVTIFIDFF